MNAWEFLANIPYLVVAIKAIIIVAVALVVERLLTRYLRRFARGRELPAEVENGLILTSRLLLLLGTVTALSSIAGMPTEWFVGFFALGGTAVGFASTRTIGNFIAGLYVLATRPFRVNDYVRVGSIEGVVREITINYTKIVTPSGTVVSISNQKILDQNITNFRCREGDGESPLYCYTFEVGFNHSLPTKRLEDVLEKVINRYVDELPRKPEYRMTKLTRLERIYTIYLYVNDPQKLFTLPPRLVREITKGWERAKLEEG